jgi:16S rRNA (guanine527-N7)-methyltransferase
MSAQLLAHGASTLGVSLDGQAIRRLLDYVDLIAKWNKVYNLTAIRETQRMLTEHVLDSLAVAPHVRSGSLLDLGSGAGLPGIPLGVARPDLQVTLLESSRKKCAFLHQAIIELGLNNVEVACVRAESYRPARGFDTVVTRAFADLDAIARLGLPLLAPGARLLAMKGAAPNAELTHLDVSVVVESVLQLQIPGLAAQRHLLVMTKQ